MMFICGQNMTLQCWSPQRNINLNNNSHIKIPSQEPRNPGERLWHLGVAQKEDTLRESKKDSFTLPSPKPRQHSAEIPSEWWKKKEVGTQLGHRP